MLSVQTPKRQFRRTRNSSMEVYSSTMLRSTRSGNYYNLPLSPTSVISTSPPESYNSPTSYMNDVGSLSNISSSDGSATSSAWGTSAMRRMSHVQKSVDFNASFYQPTDVVDDAVGGPQFKPAFPFDVNVLVQSLNSRSSSSSLSSSMIRKSSLANSFGSGSSPQQHVQQQFSSLGDSRIKIMPVEPVLASRGRRDALDGSEMSRSKGPPAVANENSIINYSLNKKKKKLLSTPKYPAYVPTEAHFEFAPQDDQPTPRRNSIYEGSFAF